VVHSVIFETNKQVQSKAEAGAIFLFFFFLFFLVNLYSMSMKQSLFSSVCKEDKNEGKITLLSYLYNIKTSSSL